MMYVTATESVHNRPTMTEQSLRQQTYRHVSIYYKGKDLNEYEAPSGRNRAEGHTAEDQLPPTDVLPKRTEEFI